MWIRINVRVKLFIKFLFNWFFARDSSRQIYIYGWRGDRRKVGSENKKKKGTGEIESLDVGNHAVSIPNSLTLI